MSPGKAGQTAPLRKEVLKMAKTGKGKKIVPVKRHRRSKPGEKRKTVPVKRHRRSTPE